MHADLIFEVLHFLERIDLEVCQLSSKFFNSFIGASTKLPLRCIDLASIEGLSVQLRIKKNDASDDDDDDEDEEEIERRLANDYEKILTAEDFDGFDRRLRNVCIEMLALAFAQEDEPVVRYWLASHSNDNFCLMELCHEIGGNSIASELFDDALRILKPKQYASEVSAHDHAHILRQAAQLSHVFERESLLSAALSLKLDFYFGDIPAAIATAWVGSSWYTCDLWCYRVSPVSWIDAFIENFTTGSFAGIAEGSMSVICDECSEYTMPRLLQRPTQANVPMPRTDFIDTHYSNRKELQCDLYSFDNANSRQSLRVYTWGIVDLDKRVDENYGNKAHAYAFLFLAVTL